jgi:arylsulfatase A-like enzyme
MTPALDALLAALAGVLVGATIEAGRLVVMGLAPGVALAVAAGALLWVPLAWAVLMLMFLVARRHSDVVQAPRDLLPSVARWIGRRVPAAACASALVFAILAPGRALLGHPMLAAAIAALVAGAVTPVASAVGERVTHGLRARAQGDEHPGRVAAIVLILAAGVVAGLLATAAQVREAMPWSLAAEALAGLLALAVVLVHRGGPRGRAITWALAGWAVALAVGGALRIADPAIGPALTQPSRGLSLTRITQGLARTLTDWDGDGVGLWLGDHDCAALDPEVAPGAMDVPGNGVDENCSGRDAVPWQPAADRGFGVAVPAHLAAASILLVTVDTLRADHVGFAGYERPTTPNLDALAARSAAFLHMETDSTATVSAFPSMFTGKPFYQEVACAGDAYPPPGGWHTCKLHDAELTMAESLTGLGFVTSAVVSHTYFEGWGLEQGFARWRAAHAQARDLDFSSAAPVTALAIEELRALRNQRFFLWVHYFDPHGRYVEHARDFGDAPVDRYDSEIAHVDEHIGVLLEALRATDLQDRTIVVVTSDHGEEFVSDHGGSDHTWAVYDTSTRVPLVVHLPGVPPARHAEPVSQLDLLPTLLHLAGAGPADAAALAARAEGNSLVAPVLGLASPPPRALFASAHHPRVLHSVRVGGQKLVVDMQSGSAELFDTGRDPRNQTDVAAAQPARVAELRELLDAWLFHAFARGAEGRAAAQAAGGAP